MDKFPITISGEKKLREELDNLTNVERPKIIDAISTARAHGDLKENAEYHAAKEQQGLIEARIREIENKLADAQVIDATLIEPSGRVIFGTTVELKDLDERKPVSYKIVGEDEAEVKLGKISVNSPLSRSLVGKSVGDLVRLETPSGSKEYEILSVKHI